MAEHLYRAMAASVLGAEGVLPPPFGGRGGEVVRQAGILPGPSVGAECGDGGHEFRGIGALVGSGEGVAGRFVRGGRASGITIRVRLEAAATFPGMVAHPG